MFKKIPVYLVIFILVFPSALFAEGTDTTSTEKTPLLDITAFKNYIQGPDGYQMLSTTHDVLGYSSVLLGLAAGLFSPPVLGVDEDIHGFLGGAATTAAVLNIGVGALNYGNRFTTSEGLFTKDNIHIVMGVTGGVLLLVASLVSESDAHPIIAGLGTGLMGASIVFQLF
ncbi:hypothetical protein [Sphaerochaeta halotolerans]|jgi:hypothetical protein|uniref:Uncharacterized protein n=1 Tax=Sphaerochaeta halotolerans TaxID=2293840 RepID=A0A372MD64_9SPIR|nr:hypothetical protein [Sphaerochaeta halotolerans]MDN5334470.1 hypothetical protein [Sphaerochaeta sp.]MXI87019.1 hypothetical protein [Sphaerochaeta halotolerans]RFU93704.1 hypothetical protein DYP60_13325 [Sphaerochaeta halotolerans]